MNSEGLALQALLARLASTKGLSPHSAVGYRCLLLLSRVGARALGTHRSGTSERVATAGAADVDHASGRQLRGHLRSELLISSALFTRTSLTLEAHLHVRCQSPASSALPGSARAGGRSQAARSSTCRLRRRQSCSCARSRCC